MIAFEVSVNGKKICTATTDCVLTTAIDWVARHPDNRIHFHVGGIQKENGDDIHCDWPTPEIGIGDEVTIRIVESDSPEPAPELWNSKTNPESDPPTTA